MWWTYHFAHMCNSVYLSNVKKSDARNACFYDIALTLWLPWFCSPVWWFSSKYKCGFRNIWSMQFVISFTSLLSTSCFRNICILLLHQVSIPDDQWLLSNFLPFSTAVQVYPCSNGCCVMQSRLLHLVFKQ